MNINSFACENMQNNQENSFSNQFDCKTNKNFDKSQRKIDKRCRNVSKLSAEEMWEEAQKTQLNIYVKTLIEAYRTLPNVIKILDQIIESRASNAMLSSGLFSNTFDEIEKVIELTERKDKLLNLYFIADNMIKMLNEKQKKFVVMKFIKKRSVDSIAEELGTTKRNVYRNANSIIKFLCLKMLERKWDSNFIRFQIGENEHWLDNIFSAKIKEENSNDARRDGAKKTQKLKQKH